MGGTWKWEKSPRPDGAATIEEGNRNLGFGEFAEWTYAAVITQKQGYVQFLLGGNQRTMPGKERFVDWIRYKQSGITMDVNTGSAD